jgi:hypothetical protein
MLLPGRANVAREAEVGVVLDAERKAELRKVPSS